MTDDVLAIEPVPDGLRAHPGACMVSLDEAEFQAMSPEGRVRLGRRLGRSDKSHFAHEVAELAVPLTALYFLRRDEQAARFSIERCRAVEPGRLLGSLFVNFVRRREYLIRQLEACALLAECVDVFDVVVPPAFDARRVAAQVETHAQDARDQEIRA
jgi:hypothetical protein